MGKRGFRAVPPGITAAVQALSSDTYYVGATKRFDLATLQDELGHLGAGVDDEGRASLPEAALPNPGRGRWSRMNVEGRVVLRKDLPKVARTYSWEAPDFGDSSRGTHTVSQTREVWQRETIFGQHLPILISAGPERDGAITLGFRVDRVFDRRDEEQGRELVFALSLLQENVGRVSAVAAQLSVQDWLDDQTVDWELLPEGERPSFEDVAARLGIGVESPRFGVMQERYAAIAALNPPAQLLGTGGFARYFGFKFRDDLVVLENLHYGNAVYVMFDDWAALSQRTRTQLWQLQGAGYERIVHRAGWDLRLGELLKQRGHDIDGSGM